jgi:hypothetical protein
VIRRDGSTRDVDAAAPTAGQVLRPAAGLATSVEIHRGRAIYEVRTGDPLYQQRLLHMGFAPAAADRFVRRLSATGDVRSTHANFAWHLQEMLLQSARQRPVRWRQALELFLERIEGSRLRWFLYGSGALAVRGIDVGPGDLDDPEPHEQGPAAGRVEHVRWHGHDVPVAPLNLQLAVNQRRGLTGRVQKIHAYMRYG